MSDRKEQLSKIIQNLKLKILSRFGSDELTDRDRRLLLGIGGFFLLLIIYLVIFSFGSAVNRLESKVTKLQQDAIKVKELKKEYLSSSASLKKLMKGSKKRSTPLISEVEKILLSQNIDRKNFSIRDKQVRDQDDQQIFDERAVDVEINSVPLDKMVDLLYEIQARPSNLKISGLRMKTRFDNSNAIDMYFRVSTFEFKEVA